MKSPTLAGKTTDFPSKAKCPICKKRKVLEPHSMAIFSGGSIYTGNKQGIPDNLEGYTSLIWHGAHDTGIGKDRDIFTRVDFARDTDGGQFEVYFCSTKCMRTFFNQWVDALETKVKKEKKLTRSASQRAARVAAD
jgi:endogenous inhibitor of DNA gyrase (YacG/DUF329 family)